MTPAQCRGARAMLEWSRKQLADASGIAERTVIDFERGARSPLRNNLAAMQRALETAGIEFTNGDAPGVRLRNAGTSTAAQAEAQEDALEAEEQSARSSG